MNYHGWFYVQGVVTYAEIRELVHRKYNLRPVIRSGNLWHHSHKRVLFRRLHKSWKSICYLRHACLSVRTEQLRSNWMDFHETWHVIIYRKFVQKILFFLNLTKIESILHEDQYTILIISRSILLRIRNVVNKIKTLILCSITLLFFENGAVNEIMWKNVEPDRRQMTIRPMRIVC